MPLCLPRPLLRVCLSSSLSLCLTAAPAWAVGAAPGQASSAAAQVTLNFPSAEIDAASRAMAAILNRPIIVDPRVKGQITLYSEQPLSTAQAYAVYQAALRGLGFAVVEHAGLLTVLPEADAKLQGATRRGAAPAPALDLVQTQVFRLEHESAANLLPVLRPLISPNNTINLNPGNNTLVVTDYASNLARLAELVAALDTPSATDVEVIRLQHCSAVEVLGTVTQLLGATALGTTTGGAGIGSAGASSAAASGGGSATAISADARLNALLVRAANPARLATVRALVARLDLPGGPGTQGSQTHLVPLMHADATRIAQVLRAAFPALGGGGAGASGSAANSLGGSTPAVAATSGAGSGGQGGHTSASIQSTSAVVAAAAPSTGGAIQADPATNSLVITAVDPLFRQVRALIEQMDSRRAQLYVESVIAEVDASKAVDVGLQWKSIFNITSTSSLSLGSLVMALKSSAGTNILSTANLVTLDNEEAKIVVGQNVPFITGSYTTSTSSNPFQTVERKDVGITLRLRPQIGADNTVRMTIFQESSSLSTTAATGTTNAGPTTNKRSIESTVVVDDGKFIVLGGLIEDSLSTTDVAVPVLGELPVLGKLFTGRSRSRSKTNLVVFLRPLIMRDEPGSARPTAERYTYMRSQQASVPAQSPPWLDEASAPSLPVWPERPLRAEGAGP